MKPIKLEETADTPGVILDYDKQHLEISGKSFPADVALFYKPIIMWIEEYIKSPKPQTILDLKLNYFNTASSKVLLDLLFKLEKMSRRGNQVKIRWFYPDDDDDLAEVGTEYEEIVGLPFEHISYEM